MSIQARITAVLIFLLIACGLSFRMGLKVKQGEWDASRIEAEQRLQDMQAKATKDRQEHADEVHRINARLADALERLRKRPERLPESARAACEGATGRELSGTDAAFLVREPARADELRAALTACYHWIDTVKGTQ